MKKLVTGFLCGLRTVYIKIFMNKKMLVKGLFRGRKDTQIIVSDKGKIYLGKRVTFQKNVSLTSCGGGYCQLETMSF